jgi:dimethylglycine dehydrogenase
MTELERAEVAIVGGGAAGCSLAYHLARLGCTDVVLLEQHELTSGSTWHAAGLCTQWSGSWSLMRVLRASVELFGELEAELGQPVDFHQTGSVRLAMTHERLDEFEHHAGVAATAGVPVEIVDADRAADLFPLVDTSGVLGAAYLPTDGHVDPTALTNAYAAGARARGVRILRHTPVQGLARRGEGWEVETPAGTVRARRVVIAAGQWSREIGRLAGVELPIVPLQHHYVVTDAIPEVEALPRELPVLRDPEASFYVRQEGAGLIVGPFERAPLTWALDGIPPGFHGKLLPPDLDQIEDVLVAAAERVPVFARAGLKTVLNGPDGYTPDGRCLMGPVPGARDLHVLAGFSIFGIVYSGGAGQLAAEWLLDGQPSWDAWELDARRFGGYASPARYVAARACEVYEREYAIHFPHEELPAGRPLRTSPLYDRLLARGAVYGVRSGWERPLWFAAPGELQEDGEASFRRAGWHEAVGRECRGVRDGVGMLDQTSFAKYAVRGPGAEAFLHGVLANRPPAEPGRIALAQVLTERGGVACDLTVTRVRPDLFYVVSAAATETHDLEVLRSHLPAGAGVEIDDVTSRYAVLTLAGPRSRELLQRVSDDDLSREAFPFFRARHVRLGLAEVLAMRLSFVGELGFELHVRTDYALHVERALREAGEDLGLVDFGYRALDAMRLEKSYRMWGSDLTGDTTPLEAGLDFAVRLDGRAFPGRDALVRQRDEGLGRRLACLVVEAGDADAHAWEPVYAGGEAIAHVASGGYGHRVEQSIAFAYLPLALAAPGQELEVVILGERRRAVVAEEPLYDPANERLRG